jgi:hypothetical protein
MTVDTTGTGGVPVTGGNDPRLRLLGTASRTEQSVAALDALDNVQVAIEVGKEADAAHVPAIIALAGLLARLVGDVAISRTVSAPPNW